MLEYLWAVLFSLTAFFPAYTLSYIAPLIQPEREAVILFGGDMMFDRSVREVAQEKGDDFLFSCITDTFQGNDLIVANLEGPITDKASVSVGSVVGSPRNFTFTFPRSAASLLKRHGIAVVNLGNNHISNFGEEGVLSTEAALEDAGIGYFGSPRTQSYLEREIRGIRFAFINYNEFEDASTVALTERQIQEANARGFLPIVYTHWGPEYETMSSPYMQRFAHRFIDVGAEIVIGSHPHVVQEHEVYEGKHIYYSLGNLVFDQYWEENVRRGLLVQVTFSDSGVEVVKEVEVELLQDRRTCPAR